MTDTTHESGFDQLAAHPAIAEPPPAEAPADPTWRAGAGRKGANRVHELIQLGKRYEAEHGLKAGRQRLVQLIELGRRYEAEHGLARPRRERKRRSKGQRAELLADLVGLLAKVCRPTYRAELQRLAEALAKQPEPAEAP